MCQGISSQKETVKVWSEDLTKQLNSGCFVVFYAFSSYYPATSCSSTWLLPRPWGSPRRSGLSHLKETQGLAENLGPQRPWLHSILEAPSLFCCPGPEPRASHTAKCLPLSYSLSLTPLIRIILR